MPQVIPVVVAAAAAAAAEFTVASVINLIATVISTAVQAALANDDRPSSIDPFSGEALGGEDATQNVRQAITPRRTVYGHVRAGGPFIRAEGAGTDNTFLHMIVAHASHEADGVLAYILDDAYVYPEQLDADGFVTTGRFANKARLRFLPGSDDQEADPDLTGETSATESDRGRGTALLYARLEFDSTVFPNGVPSFSVVMRGKKVLDPRSGQRVWTPNAALVMNDFLTSSKLDGGMEAKDSEVDPDFLIAAANICDEFVETAADAQLMDSVDTTNDLLVVPDGEEALRFQYGDRVQVSTSGTLPGGLTAGLDYYVIPFRERKNDVLNAALQLAATYEDALANNAVDLTSAGSGDVVVTKTAEPRYTVNGVFRRERDRGDIFDEIRTAMGGQVPFINGRFRILPAAFRPPTLELDETHVVSSVQARTRKSRRDLFNSVRGIYRSPLNFHQDADFPQIANTAFILEDDGEQTFLDLKLPHTSRASTAQRLATIRLKRHRQQEGATVRFTLAAFRAKAGDIIRFSFGPLGWDHKLFEVQSRRVIVEQDQQDAPVMSIELDLQATAPEVFTFDAGDEIFVDPAPNTAKPNPFDVGVPLGISLATNVIGGGPSANISVKWEQPTDAFVTSGGQIHAQFRQSGLGLDWQSIGFVPGKATQAGIPNVQVGDFYDVRLQSINTLGAESPFQTVLAFEVGTFFGLVTKADWSDDLEPVEVSSSGDFGFVGDTHVTADSWGLLS